MTYSSTSHLPADQFNPANDAYYGVNYYEYIRSDEWRLRANTAKRQAGYRCQICNTPRSKSQLDAHHRTYERLGYERLSDITILCRDCHQLYESDKKLSKPPKMQRPRPPMTESKTSNIQSVRPMEANPTATLGRKTNATDMQRNERFPKRRVEPAYLWGIPIAVLIVLAFVVRPPQNGPSTSAFQQSRDVPKLETTNAETNSLALVSYEDDSDDSKPTVQSTAQSTIQPAIEQAITAGKAECKNTETNAAATIYTGPGHTYPAIHTIAEGAPICPIAYNHDSGPIWYQLADKGWIHSDQIRNAAGGVPYASAPTNADNIPTEAPPNPTVVPTRESNGPTAIALHTRPSTLVEQPAQKSCTNGCISSPTWCNAPIKGNISYHTEERIYHLSGGQYYGGTVINPSQGERWFCSESEAMAAGWRRSMR